MTGDYKRELAQVLQIALDKEHMSKVKLYQTLKKVLGASKVLYPRQKSLVFSWVKNCKDLDFNKRETYKELVIMYGKFERHNSGVNNQKAISQTMRNARAGEDLYNIGHGSGYPTIFYICSKHNQCAEDHKLYEGKLYVDRYWRNIMKDQPALLIKRVEKYIIENNINTIQYITHEPVFLTTRPYCKHFFTPIDILTVLTESVSDLAPLVVTREKRTPRGATYKYLDKKIKRV